MSVDDGDGGDDVLAMIRNAAAAEGVSVGAAHGVGGGGHADDDAGLLPADDNALGLAMQAAAVGGIDHADDHHGGEQAVIATATAAAAASGATAAGSASSGAPADKGDAAASPPENPRKRGTSPEEVAGGEAGGEQKPRTLGGQRRNRGAAKRKAWSLAFKKEMCRKFRDGGYKTQRTFLREVNQGRAEEDKIVPSNFQKWWTEVKSGRMVLEELSTDTDDRLKRRRTGWFETVEKKLADYVSLCERGLADGSDGLTMSNLKEKAKEYAEEVGDTQFKASGTWLQKFRQRNGIQKYLLQFIEEQMEAEDAGDEQQQPEVTTSQVREAVSTLSAFAAQEKDGEMALEVARLHQRLLIHERDIALMESRSTADAVDGRGGGAWDQEKEPLCR